MDLHLTSAAVHRYLSASATGEWTVQRSPEHLYFYKNKDLLILRFRVSSMR